MIVDKPVVATQRLRGAASWEFKARVIPAAWPGSYFFVATPVNVSELPHAARNVPSDHGFDTGSRLGQSKN